MNGTCGSLQRGIWLLLVGLMLQGCASGTRPETGPQKAKQVTVEPAQPRGSGAGRPLGGLGKPVPTSPGKVTITTSARTYARGKVISAVIANGLDRTIYAEDSQSDCSIAVIERQEDASWQPITGCAERRPPVTVAIGASRGRMVLINPSSSNFAAVLGPSGVPDAGMYRLTFTYWFSDGQEPLVAHSSSFQIAA